MRFIHFNKYIFFLTSLLLILFACKEESSGFKILNPDDYNQYLSRDKNQLELKERIDESNFWLKQYNKEQDVIANVPPLVNSLCTLYKITNDESYLKKAEDIALKSYLAKKGVNSNLNILLAKVYSTGHKFKKTRDILEKELEITNDSVSLHYLLFDTYMELKDYDTSKEHLAKFSSKDGFHSLIRQARWQDSQEAHAKAIQLMEKAQYRIDSKDDADLNAWTSINLGDYYLHMGDSHKSYQYYIKALSNDILNSHAKRQLVNIAMTVEKSQKESNRILESIFYNKNSALHSHGGESDSHRH